MRLMMRWSPMRSVFSMEPEGITRAWPMVPLISKKARPTQNQAMISRCKRLPIGSAGSFSASFCFFSVFMLHRHGALGLRGLAQIAGKRVARFLVTFADFELHQVRRIIARITRRAKLSFGITHRLLHAGKREIAEGIGTQETANFFRRV